jgi:hypothetical protein
MMAKVVDISASSVQRIWRAHGLQPHWVKQFKLSTDPRFVDKLRDIVGLYVDPPAHAVVLSVDEKSQIQALDRTQPSLPMKKGRAGTMYPRLQTPRHDHAVRRSQRPSAATCSATDTKSSFAYSMPSRRRCRRERKSTPSSTTTQPTSIRRCANGWRFVAENNAEPKAFTWTADPDFAKRTQCAPFHAGCRRPYWLRKAHGTDAIYRERSATEPAEPRAETKSAILAMGQFLPYIRQNDGGLMPEIVRLGGFKLLMFFQDENPPHVHLKGADFAAKIRISNGEILAGDAPRRVLKLARQWIQEHRASLVEQWNEFQR